MLHPEPRRGRRSRPAELRAGCGAGGGRGARPHLVGSAQVLELLLRPRVVGVPVGVELQRQFPVGLLDVLDGGAAGHPQDLVEVSPVGAGREQGRGRDPHSAPRPPNRLGSGAARHGGAGGVGRPGAGAAGPAARPGGRSVALTRRRPPRRGRAAAGRGGRAGRGPWRGAGPGAGNGALRAAPQRRRRPLRRRHHQTRSGDPAAAAGQWERSAAPRPARRQPMGEAHVNAGSAPPANRRPGRRRWARQPNGGSARHTSPRPIAARESYFSRQ